jgi:hypothetical protein
MALEALINEEVLVHYINNYIGDCGSIWLHHDNPQEHGNKPDDFTFIGNQRKSAKITGHFNTINFNESDTDTNSRRKPDYKAS